MIAVDVLLLQATYFGIKSTHKFEIVNAALNLRLPFNGCLYGPVSYVCMYV